MEIISVLGETEAGSEKRWEDDAIKEYREEIECGRRGFGEENEGKGRSKRDGRQEEWCRARMNKKNEKK